MEGLDDLNTLKKVLTQILSPDNSARKQAEAQLNQAVVNSPKKLVTCLVSILEGSQTQTSTLCGILLKKVFSPESNYEAWSKLTQSTQELVKHQLLNLVQNCESKHLPEAVALLASNIFQTGSSWSEFNTFMQTNLKPGSTYSVPAVEVYIHLPVYLAKEFSDLESLLHLLLSSQNPSTRLLALKAMKLFFRAQESLNSQSLIQSAITSVDFILTKSQYEGQSALKVLTEISENTPRMFEPHLSDITELVNHIFANYEPSDQNLVLEFSVSVVEGVLSKELAGFVAQKTLELMVALDKEITDDWCQPEEGFCEEEDDYSKAAQKLLTRVIDSVGESNLLEPVSNLIFSMLKEHTDWRYPYSGLLALTEIVQYITEPQQVAALIPWIQQGVESPNPKIRYAAFLLIKQTCEDYVRDFQGEHYETILPLIGKGLLDSVSRVKLCSLGCLASFMYGASSSIVSQNLVSNLETLMNLLETTQPSYIIESACAAFATVFSSSKDDLTDWYELAYSKLIRLLQSKQGSNYKRLQGRIVECITIMGRAVGREVFGKSAPEVIQVIIQLHQGDITSADELTGYLLSAWQRICELLREDFSPYLSSVVPKLLSLAQPQEAQSLLVENAPVSSTQTENIELSITTLQSFAECTRFGEYVDDTVRVSLPLLEYTPNEDVRGSAAEILPSLIASKGALDGNQATEMAKVFLTTLWAAIESEDSYETRIQQLESVKKIIEAAGSNFLNQQEVLAIGEKTIKLFLSSLKSRENPQSSKYLEYQKELEDNLHAAISDILGAIFKTHKQFCYPILEYLFTGIFSNFLREEAKPEDQKFALYIADDIVEFLGEESVAPKWNELGQALVKFAKSPHEEIRQAACYGLGTFAQNSNNETFQVWSSSLFEVLKEACEMPVVKRIKSHGYAKDNSVAAIGRLIRRQASQEAVSYWVSQLPLRWDKQEAKAAHHLLAEVSVAYPSLVLGPNNENLEAVIRIFSDILETKLLEESTRPKIREFINSVQKLPELQQVFRSLRSLQQTKLSKLMENYSS